LIESHDHVFRRTARRYSICADDAEDAYQRALEILLTKAPPIEGDALVRWMQTVTKHEALAVRRQRERLLGSPRPPSEDDDRDPLEFIASESPGPTDRLARRERVTRSGEALRALKPQEVRALTLKAQGYSYAEIGEITGWSYTKINRCMAEGRKRFLQVFADIEQGRRCEELAAALSAMADGEDANGFADAVEFHLRSCATCRAKLRAYRAIPGRVFDLMPAGPLLDQSVGGGPHEWIAERAVAALDKVRETAYSVLSRGGGGSGEVTTLATAGGTRGAGVAAVAKVLAICGATAAGGATCVATGLVDPGAVDGGPSGQ
jgi:RNA polymerase sigma factor (sigma-70 family)